MNEFLDIVNERPDPFMKSPKCPCCGSDNINCGDASSTLVGGNNVNHHWTECQCNECQSKFTFEKKGHGLISNCWVTCNGRILHGIPSCFESYVYTCHECGGEIRRSSYDLNSGDKVSTLIYDIVDGKSVPKFRTLFECDNCDVSMEITDSNTYYHPPLEYLNHLERYDQCAFIRGIDCAGNYNFKICVKCVNGDWKVLLSCGMIHYANTSDFYKHFPWEESAHVYPSSLMDNDIPDVTSYTDEVIYRTLEDEPIEYPPGNCYMNGRISVISRDDKEICKMVLP